MTCQCPSCQTVPHTSSCAVHNEPAMRNGPCNCGAEKAFKHGMRFAYKDALWAARMYHPNSGLLGFIKGKLEAE